MSGGPLDLADPAMSQAAVAELLATLGQLREGMRVNKKPLALHPATHLAALSLWEVLAFLGRLPGFKTSGHLGALESLVSAISDLEDGVPSPMFAPAKGRNPMPTELQITMAKAATVMDAQIKLGVNPDQAARDVGRELARGGLRLPKQYKASLAATVTGWRERLMRGGANVPAVAADAWTLYQRRISAERAAGQALDPSCVPDLLADLRRYVADHPFLSPP